MEPNTVRDPNIYDLEIEMERPAEEHGSEDDNKHSKQDALAFMDWIASGRYGSSYTS